MIVSNIVLFYMVYSIITNKKDIIVLFQVLMVLNVLVILYCVVQFYVGENSYTLFGIQEFNIRSNLTEFNRIVGPFNAVGITAEYFVIQNLLLLYKAVIFKKYRILVFIVILCNFALLIGTGNRGGLISYVISIFVFLLTFKNIFEAKKYFIIVTLISSYLLLQAMI